MISQVKENEMDKEENVIKEEITQEKKSKYGQ